METNNENLNLALYSQGMCRQQNAVSVIIQKLELQMAWKEAGKLQLIHA